MITKTQWRDLLVAADEEHNEDRVSDEYRERIEVLIAQIDPATLNETQTEAYNSILESLNARDLHVGIYWRFVDLRDYKD